MADLQTTGGDAPRFRPYVPAETTMTEFTARALIIGLVMCVVLGAANAYLGLRAGMTIAATYPAAVIGMAVLRLVKGTLLEENFARTVGSIGESVAAGAIFTIPAFVILKIWKFEPDHMVDEYLTATAEVFPMVRGRPIAEARAPESGIVLYVRAVPSLMRGDTIASVGVVQR